MAGAERGDGRDRPPARASCTRRWCRTRRAPSCAIAAAADEIELVVSASETHNQKNVRRSVAESLVGGARRRGDRRTAPDIAVEAIVSTAFGCPYEGDVAPERVAQVAGHLVDAGADRLSFGDTTGMATPRRVDDLLDALDRAGIASDRRRAALPQHARHRARERASPRSSGA